MDFKLIEVDSNDFTDFLMSMNRDYQNSPHGKDKTPYKLPEGFNNLNWQSNHRIMVVELVKLGFEPGDDFKSWGIMDSSGWNLLWKYVLKFNKVPSCPVENYIAHIYNSNSNGSSYSEKTNFTVFHHIAMTSSNLEAEFSSDWWHITDITSKFTVLEIYFHYKERYPAKPADISDEEYVEKILRAKNHKGEYLCVAQQAVFACDLLEDFSYLHYLDDLITTNGNSIIDQIAADLEFLNKVHREPN